MSPFSRRLGQWQSPLNSDGDESQVLIDRLGSNVEVVRRNNATFRRIAIYGSDGRPRHFLVHWLSGGGESLV